VGARPGRQVCNGGAARRGARPRPPTGRTPAREPARPPFPGPPPCSLRGEGPERRGAGADGARLPEGFAGAVHHLEGVEDDDLGGWGWGWGGLGVGRVRAEGLGGPQGTVRPRRAEPPPRRTPAPPPHVVDGGGVGRDAGQRRGREVGIAGRVAARRDVGDVDGEDGLPLGLGRLRRGRRLRGEAGCSKLAAAGGAGRGRHWGRARSRGRVQAAARARAAPPPRHPLPPPRTRPQEGTRPPAKFPPPPPRSSHLEVWVQRG
jgi:hypothetical protein